MSIIFEYLIFILYLNREFVPEFFFNLSYNQIFDKKSVKDKFFIENH